ncbi:NAD-glutamate dehydrogenase [Williamsia sp. CHRR-6]|uniref:NAD-glutamate dehydrogenase n=1 Tax=Williamsia sp. CHRR-6 TaxID=2835871 RepID=UPI001BDA76E8|nr:NAD-glutamate dehydrogenase [Williamsia sp. CHRR-6]MBT0568290.1 NAD-glutamate dehydrogenase [Williamsia sp. CHRR-6]
MSTAASISATDIVDHYYAPLGVADHGASAAPDGAPLRSLEADGRRLDRIERHLRLGRVRTESEPLLDVSVVDGRTSVQVVLDDQPLLVEAIVGAVERVGVVVARVDHPILSVERSADGELLRVHPLGQREGRRESWISVELAGTGAVDQLDAAVRTVLGRVRHARVDAEAISRRLSDLAHRVRQVDAGHTTGEHADLIEWLLDDHLLVMGSLRGDGTGWSEPRGVFRDAQMPLPPVAVGTRGEVPVCIARTHLVTGLTRAEYPLVVRVNDPDDPGAVIAVVGELTVRGRTASPLEIPVLRDVVHAVLAGADDDSYTGSELLGLLQNYPRSELISAPVEPLRTALLDVLDSTAGRSVRLYLRADPAAEVLVADVYLPRDRYTTRLRETMQAILIDAFDGDDVEYAVRISDSAMAVVHLLMRVHHSTAEQIAVASLSDPRRLAVQSELAAAARSWDEDLAAVAEQRSIPTGLDIDAVVALAAVMPESYRSRRDPQAALDELEVIARLSPEGFHVSLDCAEDGAWELRLLLGGRCATLTDILPVLGSLGVDVIDQYPTAIVRPDGIRCWIYDLGVRPTAGVSVAPDAEDVSRRFTDAFADIWSGAADVDPFNELVLRCGLDHRGVAMLRGYARYLRQCGFGYGARRMVSVLGSRPDITAALVELFTVSLHPQRADEAARTQVLARLTEMASGVFNLDSDRVISAFIDVISATVRTNFYTSQPDSAAGAAPSTLSFKLAPRDIPQTPQPRPEHEIFVTSPRVEGVHLRFGAVARGGLRWSDRPEDFRTEILGLVKAQAVKNAVIVPVGAKGGFVDRRPPVPTGDATVDRDAAGTSGVACYREFVSALLDLTDNLVTSTDAQTAESGEPVQSVRPPAGVHRRDGDDPYLVVAADKGTASFSDIANAVAADHGFWLGDAFASGGSVGYDHKAMGITARGAWESVRRHLAEMGVDVDTDTVTAVGIGDMSGDVFGNGMLLSEHLELVAAFDHRDIFIDPEPVAAQAFAERRRLFDLPRSSWADYDPSLISVGGGVFSREAKAIDVSPQMIRALGLPAHTTTLSPPELIRAILLAPVDLLWNGGIGTYVKASTESHAAVGDKANDAIRVDGRELRARIVGEGGNLGVTEHGRIEFAVSGGRINTDALDNSAGVDCSDHEVNIKILLDTHRDAGRLAAGERDALLHSMTDEVARLVLADNRAQNLELGYARAQSDSMVEVHARLLEHLASVEGVDLELEALPLPEGLRARGNPLTSPELATLMAHVKLALKREMLATDLPDHEVFAPRLVEYFPQPLRQRFAQAFATHPLRREIVTTTLVNDVVNTAGIAHVFQLVEATGSSSVDALRAYAVVTEVFGLPALWRRIVQARAPIPLQDEMIGYTRRLVFRASRRLLLTRPQPLPVASEVIRYQHRVAALDPELAGWLRESSTAEVSERADRWRAAGVPDDLADEVAACLHRYGLLDIIDAAEIADRTEIEVGELYYALLDHLGIERLLSAVSGLDSADRWQSLARLALRDDLFAVLQGVTLAVLDVDEPGESAAEKIAEWETHSSSRLARARTIIAEIVESGRHDIATLSVAARQLRSMLR